MKSVLLILSLFTLTEILSAQENFGQCIVASLTNIDSTVGDTVYNSKNWKDCVQEKPIPDIKFKTISGKSFDTKTLKGKVVVLNFWFIECVPCIAELPALNRLVKEYKNKDVLFFGITYQSLKSLQRDFFPNYTFDFDIVQDASNITEKFAAGYPTTYIIDKQGIVRKVWNGGSTGQEAETAAYVQAKPVIDELLVAK